MGMKIIVNEAINVIIPTILSIKLVMIDQIRGFSYEETLVMFELLPYRACYPIFKQMLVTIWVPMKQKLFDGMFILYIISSLSIVTYKT
mgnify:CR=1 FL=1